ncbi:MAG: glutathione S-transferase family protein [Rhodomicrobium sp.]
MAASMITLYTFGPAWGIPDPSPFVTKAIVLLKLSGLPFETNSKGFGKAPRGKLPYIRDREAIVSDSTLIRFHLEQRHKIDFDRGLTPEQRGIAWAVEKMCEDHLYWLMVQARWLDGDNFARGPASFFKSVPAPLRPLVGVIVRRQVRRNLWGQGAGRYTPDERTIFADRAFGSLAAILGEKPYLMGDAPCGADATVFAFVGGSLCPVFETGLRSKAEAYPNLRAYCNRLSQQFFPG